MNRERLLLVVVLAIVALWAFVLREPPRIRSDAGPKKIELTVLPVGVIDSPERVLTLPRKAPFTLITNEVPHARPVLEATQRRDLPGIWPPTSRSVGLEKLGLLRRRAAAPVADEAGLELPELPGAGTDSVGGETEVPVAERVDRWFSFKRENEGRVTGLVVKGRRVLEPRELSAPGPAAAAAPFHRLVALLEIDPERAAAEGVTDVQVQFKVGGKVWQKLGTEINDIHIAAQGAQQGWWEGLKAYLRLKSGYQARLAAGRRLLGDGRSLNDRHRLRWALVVLEEGRQAAEDAPKTRTEMLEYELEAARLLNRQEDVLRLAFDHLSRHPDDEKVLEYVGNILAGRSFGLLALAEEFFARAESSQYAQRRRVEVLIRQGKFAAARALIDSGRAGAGGAIDLLTARVALALGDLDLARAKATPRVGTEEFAVEAHQILGGAAYASGDAAGAEAHFLEAVRADPGRSTAYSDLGLALAAQGRVADANVCFDRASKLDPVDNSVLPRLARLWERIVDGEATHEAAARARAAAIREEEIAKADEQETAAQAAFAEAAEGLAALADDNPRDLLVRYFHAYSLERSGDLEGAAALYRSTLDDDHRYRVAIARLGLVRATLMERSGDAAAIAEPRALLGKSVDLNANDPLLPYILGRFLMVAEDAVEGTDGKLALRGQADRMLERCAKLPAPADDPDLPLWAQAGRAALLYRDRSVEVRQVKGRFNAVREAVRYQQPAGTPEKTLLKHPVYAYATRCLERVKENESKVDKVWEFPSPPRDWNFKVTEQMGLVCGEKGVQFQGEVDYGGKDRTEENLYLRQCAIEYEDPRSLTGTTFYELTIEGTIPENPGVYVGFGLLNKGRGRRGWSGIQVRRHPRNGTLEMRLDGGEHEVFKRMRGPAWIEFRKVAWPAGKFKLHIALAGGDNERHLGRFTLTLNGTNVFSEELGIEAERSAVLGRGRSNRPMSVFGWVEGNEGVRYNGIYVEKVVLTKKAR